MTTNNDTPLLGIGDAAPWFVTASATEAHFHLASLGGRFVILTFIPGTTSPVGEKYLTAASRDCRGYLQDGTNVLFAVTRDGSDFSTGRVQRGLPGLRYFLDANHAITSRFRDEAHTGPENQTAIWTVILDPMLRVYARISADQDGERHAQRVFDAIKRLPSPIEHAGVPVQAPVLVVPRVFEPEFCRALIAHYETQGGTPSGFMREQGGITVGVTDPSFKRRTDCAIEDPALIEGIQSAIGYRLRPMIRRAFSFDASRIERYIVARYGAEDQGFFRAHRDNTTRGTAHRRFAVTINLNAEDYEGGDLCFPEFGPQTYRAPTGGAVVFSCSLLHEARPVTRGQRYACLPFLYDDAAARIREENLVYLARQNGGQAEVA